MRLGAGVSCRSGVCPAAVICTEDLDKLLSFWRATFALCKSLGLGATVIENGSNMNPALGYYALHSIVFF